MNSLRQLSALCNNYQLYSTVITSIRHQLYQLYQLYATVINPIQQLSALPYSYQLYATVINPISQLSALCDSYWLYATVMNPTQQLWILLDSYQLYAIVISPVWQLLALCDSYQLYPTVISSMQQLWVLFDSYFFLLLIIFSSYLSYSYFRSVMVTRSRRFFNGYSKLAKEIYYFCVRISSIKVFSLLVTWIGEATGINCEYLLNVLLVLIWCILKLETFILRLISSALYWYAVIKLSI